MKKSNIILALSVFTIAAHAQVGIGTTQPNSTAALHIDGKNKKGVIIPVVSDTLNLSMNSLSVDTVRNAKGLLVFVEKEGRYYMWDSARWQCVNPYITNSTNKTVTVAAPYTTLTGNFNGNVNGNLAATGTNTFSGNGTIPVGGIIMWSGVTAPVGWAICDGRTVNGITTPNLSNRFILASYPAEGGWPGNLSESGTSVGDTGGAHHVILTAAQSGLPAHSHIATDSGHGHTVSVSEASGKQVGENKGGGEEGANDDRKTLTTATGHANISVSDNVVLNATEYHENRPEYYVLAFIMRIQ